MIIRENVPIYSICWINHVEGGMIGTFYEPENKEELADLCRNLYKEDRKFDLIGYTSNIYFLPNYNADIIVSTRKVRDYKVYDRYIVADCGVNVRNLSRVMIDSGIKGFEGLVDLPGTVGASVYGNASCYGCSINSLLESFELLKPNGEIEVLKPSHLSMSRRSTTLKRGELNGVILSVRLRKILGNVDLLQSIATKNHRKRKNTQPSPNDNLGSIYSVTKGWSVKSILPRFLANCYCILLLIFGKKRSELKRYKLDFILTLLGAKELKPYVYGWNRYIWRDKRAHELFWKFHQIHRQMFKKSEFEIEIKGKQ